MAMAMEERANKRAGIRWMKFENLQPFSFQVNENAPFASISLFGRRKQRNVGEEVVVSSPPLPYSPKRGTYAYEALQRRFKDLDKENAGFITENDVKVALKSLNLPASERDVQGFMESLGGGAVPFDRFAQYAVNTENQLFDTFKELDKKNTGYLTAGEVRSALQKYSFRVSDSDFQELAKAYSKVRAGPFDDQLFDFADYRDCLMLFSQKDLRDVNEPWGRAIIDLSDIDTSFPLSGTKRRAAGYNPLPKQKLLKHVLLGAVTSAFTRTLISPLERFKLLSMVDPTVSKEPIKALKQLWREDGVSGLFRGNLLNVARIIPTRVAEFIVYDKLKDVVLKKKKKQPELSNSDRLFLGSIASMAGIVAGYPLDTLRTVIASQVPNRHVDDMLVRSIMDNGIGNVFKGLGPNLVRAVPYTFISFSIFDNLQERYRQKVGPGGEIPTSVNTLFGILSAAAAQTAVFPLEVVQRRLQVESAKQGAAVYQNMLTAFQTILEKEGVTGLYSGLPASYAKIVPATAISLVLYNTMKKKLDEKEV